MAGKTRAEAEKTRSRILDAAFDVLQAAIFQSGSWLCIESAGLCLSLKTPTPKSNKIRKFHLVAFTTETPGLVCYTPLHKDPEERR